MGPRHDNPRRRTFTADYMIAVLAEYEATTEAAGIWTIQSGVFPENAVSLALHATTGFRLIGTREKVGRMSYGPMAGRWRDTVLLERRSPTIV